MLAVIALFFSVFIHFLALQAQYGHTFHIPREVFADNKVSSRIRRNPLIFCSLGFDIKINVSSWIIMSKII